jgi:hypothetical protein
MDTPSVPSHFLDPDMRHTIVSDGAQLTGSQDEPQGIESHKALLRTDPVDHFVWGERLGKAAFVLTLGQQSYLSG